MGYFTPDHDHGQSSRTVVFLLGAIFNILANTEFSNLLDYALKALIGGFIWLLFKLVSDYISGRIKGKSRKDDEKQGN